jgi:ethanolamine ammonia-lyase large subunit
MRRIQRSDLIDIPGTCLEPHRRRAANCIAERRAPKAAQPAGCRARRPNGRAGLRRYDSRVRPSPATRRKSLWLATALLAVSIATAGASELTAISDEQIEALVQRFGPAVRERLAGWKSRKYGFARALKAVVAAARAAAGHAAEPWVHVNDVAGFIGPEVFRTREQLVRVCLEDTVMGKLHGLTIGLDICSTLHMDVSLDDLGWCIEQVMPANPAYLMALPTRNDPMLSYLTTSFQDHVRVREQFGYKVDDLMWAFFERLGVIDHRGQPTSHFGDPSWVYLQYKRACGDTRDETRIVQEANERLARVRGRGVFIASGHGAQPWDLDPAIDRHVRQLYEDAKSCIFAEVPRHFPDSLAPSVLLETRSVDREDYVLHPPSGETLSEASLAKLGALRVAHAGRFNVQIVVSDGLNAYSLTDKDHLAPYLAELRRLLAAAGFHAAPEHIVVTRGRVRAGYRIGERLFGGVEGLSSATVVHVIGERPGNGHHTYSVYVTTLPRRVWSQAGVVDHNHTRVISNVADSALHPVVAAQQTVATVTHK